jgi:hypothetical protein
MPNGRSGAFHVSTRALIAALRKQEPKAIVGTHQGEPVFATTMLNAAETAASAGILVEEQYGAWFIVRLPNFWVSVKEDSPLFAGLTDAINSYPHERCAEPENVQRPIEHCYWVIPGKLLAGEYPGALDKSVALQRIQALASAGVAAYVDLTQESDGLESYSEFVQPAHYQRFGIRDVSIPDSARTTRAILDSIDQHLAAGRLVYVHCWGGVGRTGVIVGCWLARHGLSGNAAVERLAELWKQCPKSAKRKSPETRAQVDFIKGWHETPSIREGRHA